MKGELQKWQAVTGFGYSVWGAQMQNQLNTIDFFTMHQIYFNAL